MTIPSSSQAINWFEIPCADLGRAQSFYERMLDRPMRREDFGGEPMALFSKDDPATGGCLVAGPQRRAAQIGREPGREHRPAADQPQPAPPDRLRQPDPLGALPDLEPPHPPPRARRDRPRRN